MDPFLFGEVAIGLAIVVGLIVLGRVFEWLGRVLRPPKRRPSRRGRRSKKPKSRSAAKVPTNGILVDGSNVMHWGGDPSQKVLRRVVSALKDRGFAPIVVFDASVGYRLFDHYVGGTGMADKIGLPRDHVYVVPKGVVADTVILDMAQIHGLRVVSNDRFRDWRTQFPKVFKKGVLIQGLWQDGTVMWRDAGLLR